jgi:5,10-methylenetetrahydromethanopterin reductase
VFNKLMEYHEAGVRCPIVSTLGDKEQTLSRLAQAAKD